MSARVVLLRDLPESARQSLAPALVNDRALVIFDAGPRAARRFARAIDVDGVLVLPKAETTGGAPC